MTALVLRGDARCLPLPDSSVDLIVTSPPYFGLRSYTDGGEHYSGQIGSESTPAEYVAALLACTREWCRVLKGSGSLWVNLGDKYATGSTPGPQSSNTTLTGGRHKGVSAVTVRKLEDGRPKSLLGLPWRYALGCIDQLGLILRAEVIWSKPNGLPESVTDRVRRSHEQWFHFTRQPRYYSAVDEIREQYAPGTAERYRTGYGPSLRGVAGATSSAVLRNTAAGDGGPSATNPLGKLPGSVWDIPSQPLTVPPQLGVDHFAAFPMELPRRIILGWSPPGICVECGEGRRPKVDRRLTVLGQSKMNRAGRIDLHDTSATRDNGYQGPTKTIGRTEATITGYACACVPDPKTLARSGAVYDFTYDATSNTRPAVVLDPFGGTGTTALVADVLGRTGISVDRSADYCRLGRWRTTDPGEKARALQVDKPAPVIDGQGELFAV